MDEYQTIATVMRALRLLALILSMSMATWWGPSLVRRLRGKIPVAVAEDFAPVDVARERETARAIWALVAVACFLFQVRWLSPWLPDAWAMRVWAMALGLMNVGLLWAIYHHGAGNPRFSVRRTILAHAALFMCCVGFSVVSR